MYRGLLITLRKTIFFALSDKEIKWFGLERSRRRGVVFFFLHITERFWIQNFKKISLYPQKIAQRISIYSTTGGTQTTYVNGYVLLPVSFSYRYFSLAWHKVEKRTWAQSHNETFRMIFYTIIVPVKNVCCKTCLEWIDLKFKVPTFLKSISLHIWKLWTIFE